MLLAGLLFTMVASASHAGVRRKGCGNSPLASVDHSVRSGNDNTIQASTTSASGPPVSPVPTSSTSSEQSTATTTVPEPFLLQIQVKEPQSPLRRKRLASSGSYLEDKFSTSQRCEQGAQFRLIDGRLLRNGALVSIFNAQRAQPLLEAGSRGNIATTFYIIDGILAWRNPRFPRQTVSFCIMTDMIFVYFDAAPSGCIDMMLSFSPLSECPGLQSLPATTVSSTQSASASVLSAVDVPPSRTISHSGVSSGDAPRDKDTSKSSLTAPGTAPKNSAQGSSTTSSASAVLTTISGRPTIGTWTRASPSLSLSSSNSAAADLSQSYSQLYGAQKTSANLSPMLDTLAPPSPSTNDNNPPTSAGPQLSSPTKTLSLTLTTSKAPDTSTHISSSTASAGASLSSAELPGSTVEVTATWLSSSSSKAPDIGSTDAPSSKIEVLESSQSPPNGVNMPSDLIIPPTSTTPEIDSTTSLSSFSSSSTDIISTSSDSSISTATSAAVTPTCDGFHGYENYERSGQHLAVFPQTGYAACLAACETTTGCLSFGLDELVQCLLYSYAIEDGMRDVPASPNIFYNKRGICPQGSSQGSCRAIIPGTFPDSIGGATLIYMPTSPEKKVNFGFRTDTVGSIGYTDPDPGHGDYIAFYGTNMPDTSWGTVGYLYHQRSGLCMTATAPDLSRSERLYSGASIQLQPCNCANSMPPEAQAFLGSHFRLGGCSVLVHFKGDNTIYYPYGISAGPTAILLPYTSPFIYSSSC